MKVVKIKNGYKITKDEMSIFSCLNPFYTPRWVQAPIDYHRAEEPPRDLFFTNKKNAEVYLEFVKHDKEARLSFEYRLKAGKCQLQAILDYAQINYQWADLWAGSGFWSMVILSLVNKPVLYVDYSQYNLEPGFDLSFLINRLKIDTSSNELPLNITGAFLRSTISDSSILKIIENNPKLDLLIVVPEGMTSNDGMIHNFQKKKNEYFKYFSYVEIVDLYSDLCIKGSESQHLVFNRYFPVYILKGRKL